MVKISNDIFIGVNLNEVCLASPNAGNSNNAWNVNNDGNLDRNNVDNADNIGLRPDFLQNRDLRNQGT